jgi:proteasome alpha subunit
VEALSSVGGEGGQPRQIDAGQLEVAVLDRRRPGRSFRRITGAALTPLLAPAEDGGAKSDDKPGDEPSIGEPGSSPADKSPGGVDPLANGEG